MACPARSQTQTETCVRASRRRARSSRPVRGYPIGPHMRYSERECCLNRHKHYYKENWARYWDQAAAGLTFCQRSQWLGMARTPVSQFGAAAIRANSSSLGRAREDGAGNDFGVTLDLTMPVWSTLESSAASALGSVSSLDVGELFLSDVTPPELQSPRFQ
jgi:hypothetical protein